MIKKIIAIACVAFVLWVGLSACEIGFNSKIEPKYSPYNFFVVMSEKNS